ncbi:hypothetical protein A2483_02590 [Candidatus Peregrinibacteria bacterium RIFOXYC2_FULL_33_13]|nr:MAG: hypothetical protein A2483_02590 [Candidatus Peregrinibacteria bacterium RIFOXYC2_FULL_33_13]
MLKNLIKKSKSIHVLGASGQEGASILAFLNKMGVKNVIAHDFCEEQDFKKSFEIFHKGLKKRERNELWKKIEISAKTFYFKDNYLENIFQADLIFAPQSWHRFEFNKKVFEAKRKGIPVFSMSQLYLEFNQGFSIGVTGSNGKTTTSNLIKFILSEIFPKLTVNLVGNDRANKQILEDVQTFKKDSILVLEMSNRQLKFDFPKTPIISVITNITENHLDEHNDFKDYAQTKAKIIGKNTKYAVLNYDNEFTREIGSKLETKVIYFSLKEKLKNGVYFEDNNVYFDNCFLGDLRDFQLKGDHNKENLLAAVATIIAYFLNGNKDYKKIEFSKYWKEFKTVSKRLELVKKVKGIEFYDDVSSTTPESTIKGLEAFKKDNVILILGGNHKNTDYRILSDYLKENKIKFYILPGNVRGKVKTRGIKKETLEEVILEILENALKKTKVLISPAGENFHTLFLRAKGGIKKMVIRANKQLIWKKYIDEKYKNLWRYHKLLNKKKIPERCFLQIDKDFSPLENFQENLYFKREDKNKLGSHKTRSLGYQISYLYYRDIKRAAISTTGNAGICVAAYSKKAKIDLTVFVSPKINKGKLSMLKKAKIDLRISEKSGEELKRFLNETSAWDLRPSRDINSVYGMKSLGFEIYEQMPNLSSKYAIFLYASSGSSLIGLFEAFSNLKKLKLIKSLPQIHVVQSGKVSSSALYFDKGKKNFKEGNPNIELRAKKMINCVKKTKGFGWYIENEEYENARKILRKSKIKIGEESIKAFAGYLRAVREKKKFKKAVVIVTGKRF